MSGLSAALIGADISRTRLPAALELMCRAAGLGFSFELIDTAGRAGFDFDACVNDLRARGLTGVSVTHPHKMAAAAYAGAGMASGAAHLGAANLLVFAPAGVRGFNTDYEGFLSAWRAEMGGAAPGVVAMAGAGGVARALGPALARLGAARIEIWDPAPGRAAALAAEIDGAVAVDDPAAAIRGADGLVNATALGMGADRRSAFDPALLGGQGWAFDAVYTPPVTPFLAAAAAAGLKTLGGFELFRHMAIASFAAYAGRAVDAAGILPRLAALRPG